MAWVICTTICVGILIFFIRGINNYTFQDVEIYVIAAFGLIFLTLIIKFFREFIDDIILEKWIDEI